MDMHPAAWVDHSSRMAQGAHYILKLAYLAVTELLGVHLHFTCAIADGRLMPSDTMSGIDAGIIDKPPCFSFVVGDLLWVVGAGFIRLAGGSAEQCSYCLCFLLPGKARHLNLAAKVLVF